MNSLKKIKNYQEINDSNKIKEEEILEYRKKYRVISREHKKK